MSWPPSQSVDLNSKPYLYSFSRLQYLSLVIKCVLRGSNWDQLVRAHISFRWVLLAWCVFLWVLWTNHRYEYCMIVFVVLWTILCGSISWLYVASVATPCHICATILHKLHILLKPASWYGFIYCFCHILNKLPLHCPCYLLLFIEMPKILHLRHCKSCLAHSTQLIDLTLLR